MKDLENAKRAMARIQDRYSDQPPLPSHIHDCTLAIEILITVVARHQKRIDELESLVFALGYRGTDNP